MTGRQQKNRYCKIFTCKYFVGTKSIRMFRDPKAIDWRKNWDDALANEVCSNGDLICIEHFRSEDYSVSKSGTITLKKNAVPTIFLPSREKPREKPIDVFDCTTNVINATDGSSPVSSFGGLDPLLCENCQQSEVTAKLLQTQLDEMRIQNEALQLTINTQNDEIKSLTSELNELSAIFSSSSLAHFSLNAEQSEKTKRHEQILSCLAVGIGHREMYPPVVRNFCLSLNNTSPAAYRFLRKEFNNHIPAPATIRDWHANADINVQPGIIKHSMEILKRLVEEKAANNKKLIGALLFDEITIRKLLQWLNDKMIGYEDHPFTDKKSAKIAGQAIVFMFSGINEDIQIPIAYYFIASLEADDKGKLVSKILNELLDCGIYVPSVSFDGHKTNPCLCRLLGADLDVFSDTFNPSLIIKNSQIDIIYDPSHVIKLLRTSLASGKLFDPENKPIKWEYLEQLVKFGTQKKFGSMHKMTQAHIDYQSNPMKVILAFQTLSASTANALEYLMDQGFPQFAGAGATIKYIRMCNDLSDVLNSTRSSNFRQNPLKNMMSAENLEEILEFFGRATTYFRSLQYKNDSGKFVKACSCKIKTAFVGCVINMKNVISVYERLLRDCHLSQFATHTMSQDHLEIFFGKIRAFRYLGNNNNPSCLHFNAAMRKLLANTTINLSERGNCTVLNPISEHNPFSNISTITSRRSKTVTADTNKTNDFTPDDIEGVLSEIAEIQRFEPRSQFTDLSDITTAYIASTIEIKIEISDKYSCQLCKVVFGENEKVHQAFTSASHTRRACQSTFDICRAADYFLKLEILKGQFSLELISHSIMSSLDMTQLYPGTNFLDHTHPKKELIINVLSEYIRYKGNFLAKSISFNEFHNNLRRRLHRLIINNNV